MKRLFVEFQLYFSAVLSLFHVSLDCKAAIKLFKTIWSLFAKRMWRMELMCNFKLMIINTLYLSFRKRTHKTGQYSRSVDDQRKQEEKKVS